MTDPELEDVACGCQGECEHTPVLSEVVLPALRPRSVRMRALDRRGLVEMAYGRGAGPILAIAGRRQPVAVIKADELEEPAAG